MLTDEALGSVTGVEDALIQEAEQLEERELPRCIHAAQIETMIQELLGETTLEETSANICKILDIYLEQPFLLNSSLDSWIPPLAKGLQQSMQTDNWLLAMAISRVLVAFCKVQGAKTIRLFFEHKVEDFVPILLICKQAFEHSSELNPDGWQLRYAAMVMASTVLLLPFDLQKLNAKAASKGHPSLLSQVVERVEEKLIANGGRERQAAVLFLSTLMSRNDCDSSSLYGLFRSAVDLLSSTAPQSALGALECLHAVMKRGCKVSLDMEPILDSLDKIEGSNNSHLRRIRLKIYGQCRGPLASRSLSALVNGLSDTDTIVRWTASKYCAQLCKDLPSHAVESVAENLLTTLCDNLSSAFPSTPICHGISLTLAQLCRLKLLPERLLGPLIQVAARDLLRFEAPRGKFATTGTAIRDAACFIIWAMVRSFQYPTPPTLPAALVCTSLFDREVSCRRASAAALQELVGRWDVPHGVGLLDKINFFTTHHLRQTMEETAKEIAAAYAIYQPAMMDYLINRSISNWDRQVRTLAAPLLAHLIVNNDGESTVRFREQLFVAAQCPDDISAQHGAILTLSWFTYDNTALLSRALPVTLLLDHISPKMLGWELVAEAVHRLVAKICCAAKFLQHSIDEPTTESWLRGALQALQSRDATLHELVSYSVLPALVALYPTGSPIISDYFRGSILPAADKDRNSNAQRGCTLAILAIPDWLFQERLVPLSKLLIKFIRGSPGIQIEKQVNAIRVIGVLYGKNRVSIPVMTSKELVDTVLEAMDNYVIDARGDIGSLVRLAAMETFPMITTEEQMSTYEAKLARHIFDKLDKLRRRAIQLFPRPLEGSCWEALLEASFDTARFMELWDTPPLRSFFASWNESVRSEALLGLVSSAGSVNPLVATPARELLCSWLDQNIVQQTSLFSLLSQHYASRLQRPILMLLSRTPRLDPTLPEDLLLMVRTVASNLHANMHDVLVSAKLLVRLASIHSLAASWIAQAAVAHPFPRVRQICLGDPSDDVV